MQTTSLFAFTLLCFAVLGARSAPNASSSSLRHLSNGSKLGSQVGNPTFMVTNGVTASSELCLTVEGGLVDSDGAEIVLMPCASAIAAGDACVQGAFQVGSIPWGGRIRYVCSEIPGNPLHRGSWALREDRVRALRGLVLICRAAPAPPPVAQPVRCVRMLPGGGRNRYVYSEIGESGVTEISQTLCVL